MVKTTSSRIEEIPKRVWTPEAEWTVSRAEQEVAKFQFPAFGPNAYNEVVKQVLDNNQRLPTGEQSAVLLDEAYNSADESIKENPRAKFIRDKIIWNSWLWVPVVNVWTPRSISNPGMYSVFDENGEGLGRVYTPEDLEDRLSGGKTERGVRFSKDRKVSFASLNTIRGEYHEKGTPSQDGAFIGNYGVEGAEAFDRVAERFRFKPYSWIVNNTSDKNIQTLSALDWDRSFDGSRLIAYFGSNGDDRVGYVVSVSGSKSLAEGEGVERE